MKTRFHSHTGIIASLLALGFGFVTSNVRANEGHDHGKVEVAPASGKADYPLDTCVVSGDKLEGGDMGGPYDYIHKEAGKPDRLVRFCCKGCIKDFKKEPAKYLKMLDDATAAKTKTEKPAASDAHSGHAH